MSDHSRQQGLHAGDFEIAVTDEIHARYQAGLRAVWMRMSPRPRACFTPALLAGLDRWTALVRAGGGSLASPDGPAPLDYVVNASAVPGVFNFGGDLELFTRLIEDRDRDGLVAYGTACIRVLYENHVAYDLPLTTVSLVQGECLGGGFEAALSSDIVVAERQARFGFPEVLFNLFPGMGAYSFLQRRVKRRVSPVTFQELLEVVHPWSDCGLRLTGRDLKPMQRLVSRQNILAEQQCRSALAWPTDP